MNTADKLALLYPGKKWRVVYNEGGTETIEWQEKDIRKPTTEELDAAEALRPKTLAERVAALEAAVFKD